MLRICHNIILHLIYSLYCIFIIELSLVLKSNSIVAAPMFVRGEFCGGSIGGYGSVSSVKKSNASRQVPTQRK